MPDGSPTAQTPLRGADVANDAPRSSGEARIGRARARADRRLRGSEAHEGRDLEGREPQRRLSARADEPDPDDALRMIGEDRGEPFTVRLVETKPPGPNAPLLMRIVRHPFALPPGRFAREAVRDPAETATGASEARARSPIGPPGAAWREARREGAFRNPIRALPHRPEPRPRAKGLVNKLRGTGA